jgi:hypothetical protein
MENAGVACLGRGSSTGITNLKKYHHTKYVLQVAQLLAIGFDAYVATGGK